MNGSKPISKICLPTSKVTHSISIHTHYYCTCTTTENSLFGCPASHYVTISLENLSLSQAGISGSLF